MKLLLDENLPHELRRLLPGHEVFTTSYMGWSGLRSGELLHNAATSGLDALVTLDSGIEFEQNPAALTCALVIIRARSNKIEDLRPLIPALLSGLANLKPKTNVRVP